jgi:hypothetical protein
MTSIERIVFSCAKQFNTSVYTHKFNLAPEKASLFSPNVEYSYFLHQMLDLTECLPLA